MKHFFLSLVYLFLFEGCLAQGIQKILFVGNSLTYTNNLPELVSNEAKIRGIKLKNTMLAYPNYALVDHLKDGEVQKRIRNGKFDYVIVQQGPSSQEEGRRMLLESGKTLKMLCKQNGTQLVFFMVWPSQTYYYTFDGVIRNHREVATQNDAILCPVGEVWKDYFESQKDYSLYGSDGFHPSPKGSRLAAKVIIDTIFGNE
ncbi:SGNH/GDSL hydrolase family protein [Ekhidna sp.]